MNYLTVIPVVDEATTDACVASLSSSVRDHVLIIDNSQDGFARKYKLDTIWHPENLGVARSWNTGARRILDEGLDYLILVSASMHFTAGMDDFVQHLEDNIVPYGLETQHAWHCIALGRPTFERIGLFDENFYPAYYEESDFIRRMELAGIHNPMSKTQRLPRVTIKATCQRNAHALKSGTKVNMQACRDYFISKWGNDPRYDTQSDRDTLYLWPFNNHKHPVDYWESRTIQALKDTYGISTEEPAPATHNPLGREPAAFLRDPA